MSETTIGPERTPVVPGYETYNLLLGGQNMAHPARQGFGEGEYAEAVNDPSAASTEIRIQGEPIKVPLLAPLSHVKWLNEDFYARKYPDINVDSIMCFNNSLGVDVSPEVQTGLRQLAEKEGVLVFDYPTSDPEYLENVTTMIDSLGINRGEIEELGTQTYFAGKIRLKQPGEKLERPLGFADAFKKMVAEGHYDISRVQDGASLATELPQDVAENLNEFYDDAFQVLNNHPCKQGLSPQEFTEMVADDKEVVKILYSNQGVVETLCILGEDLSKFDWINPSFFNAKYPIEYANKQIAYFPAIATDPDKQGARNSEAIINLLAELCEAGDNEVIVAFDCCDMNNGFLDVLLEQMINATPETSIHFTPIDVQRYCAVRLSA